MQMPRIMRRALRKCADSEPGAVHLQLVTWGLRAFMFSGVVVVYALLQGRDGPVPGTLLGLLCGSAIAVSLALFIVSPRFVQNVARKLSE